MNFFTNEIEFVVSHFHLQYITYNSKGFDLFISLSFLLVTFFLNLLIIHKEYVVINVGTPNKI